MRSVCLCLILSLFPSLVIAQERIDQVSLTAIQNAQKELGLSAQQKRRVEVLRAEYAKKELALREELKTKREALRTLLEADKVERVKVDALIAEIGSIQNKSLTSIVDVTFKLRGVLTPAQYTRLRELRQKNKTRSASAAKRKK